VARSYEFENIEIHEGAFAEVLDDTRAVNLFITSPPYNIGSKSEKRLTNRKYGGYDAKSWQSITGYEDSLPEDEYQEQQIDFLLWCEERLAPGGAIVYNHKNRHVKGQLITPYQWLLRLQSKLVIHDEIVWDRGSTHNHAPSFTYPESERIYVLKRPKEKIYFRNQEFFWSPRGLKGCGDVWQINPAKGNEHNAPFPLHMAQHCVRLFSRPGDLVCDPYLGSGTSALAAALENRAFIGSERVPEYFDLARKRLRKLLQGAA